MKKERKKPRSGRKRRVPSIRASARRFPEPIRERETLRDARVRYLRVDLGVNEMCVRET